MPLQPGDKLGPYECIALIGKGGMGEVYKALDTKLDREVAIKILPSALAQDPERLARFEREAKVLASLNHPNIAQVYAIEESSTGRALVMELVPGETLKGPFPLETALKYAKQIAEALEAAHDKGITHRDLKPANIMVTPAGTVKVLDFGLAAVTQPSASSSGDPSNSPTLTMRATQAGMILGTAGYMAPEQAAGQPVDRRADIWAFGVVLYEMLTGQRLFSGDSIAHILADVLRAPIDFDKLPKETPRAIRELVKRCLERDVKTRLRDIGEARIALENPGGPEVPLQAESLGRSKAPWAVAALTTVVAVALAFVHFREADAQQPLMRLSVDLGPEAVAGANITAVISPDGTRLVYLARGPGGKQQLETRLIDQTTPSLMRGTENASDPFFSPDGQWVGFFADNKMKKISLQGGAPVTLCDANRPMGASWGQDGNIIAALNSTAGLSSVPEAGGIPQRLTTPEHELTYRYPQVLPGSNAVLFTASLSATPDDFENANIDVLNLKTGVRKTLIRDGYFGRFLPTGRSIGHLVYVQQGSLFGVLFDPARLEVRGAPIPLVEDVAAEFDFSRTGTFLYKAGNGRASDETWPVVWLDSTGKTQPLIPPGIYNTPRFSPNGRQLAIAKTGSKGRDIYIYDLQTDNPSPVTFDGQQHLYPLWTPDGKHLVFNRRTGGDFGISWTSANGAGQPINLLSSKNLMIPFSFSPDGKRLAYSDLNVETGSDLWSVQLDLSDPEHPKADNPEVLLRTSARELHPAFSPNGQWIAYTSDDSGRFEIFVASVQGSPPSLKGKIRISTDGGANPIWSPDSRKLYFTSLDHQIMVAPVMPQGASFGHGKPSLWSPTEIRQPTVATYLTLFPKSNRFAVFPAREAKEQQDSVHMVFLLNFFDELRRKVPTGK